MADELYIVQMRKSSIALEDLTLQMMARAQTQKNTDDDSPPFEDTDSGHILLNTARHSHQYSELFACTDGKVWLSTEPGLLQLNAGDLAVVPPGVPHVHIPNLQEKGSGVLSFTGVRRQTPNTQPLYHCLADFFAADDLLVLRGHPELCAKVTEILADVHRHAEYLPVLKLAELLLSIRELQPDHLQPATEPGENELSRSTHLEYLIDHYFTRSVTAEQIAEKMYISPRQLARIIRQRYDSTLHALMMDKRITTGQHLLRTTALTIDEIAHIIGFGSRTGFYREFTRRCGVTPAQYRQNGTD